jgi:uncharacterized protein YhaN
MSVLKKRIALEEVLKKQLVRREQLDEEAVDHQVDEAFSPERAVMQGIVFVFGAFMIFWGIGYLFGLNWFHRTQLADPNRGLMFIVIGLCSLFATYMLNFISDKGKSGQLDDVEDQLDAVRREIQKLQIERDELDRRLPVHKGEPEMRLRELEESAHALESLLPIQQNLEAARQRHQAARKRASQAAESLKSAKSSWKRTLQHFGLSETMSPKSIRLMAEGYDSLLQTRRRITSLTEELDNRQLELGGITQRIDSLYRQAFAVKAASDALAAQAGGSQDLPTPKSLANQKRSDKQTSKTDRPIAAVKATIDEGERALEQLTKLQSLISSQEQYIHQRRELKEQDQQLAKQAASVERSIEKIQRSHSSLLAEHHCETEEQLLALLEAKHEHYRLESEVAGYAQRIGETIAGNIPMETIARMLDHGADDLEKRREAIGSRSAQARQRVEQLHQRQGELNQEMKSLAADGRLAEAKLELACIENQIKACSGHWQTLATTTHLLDKVCEVYETERQPETLREASGFLSQLTEGKYVRIWTPLGKNQLRVDNKSGQSLPLEVLSRGTREAVFIALRLSLAAAYSRRGVMVPLVLDDVLVNFDSIRAESAAKVLRDFASLGHQVVMFTCHEHIMRIFHKIGVQVRVLPNQGTPGEAEIYYPEQLIAVAPVVEPKSVEPYLEPTEEIVDEPEPLEPIIEPIIEPTVELPAEEPLVAELVKPRPTVRRIVVVNQEPEIDWLWYERTPESLDWGWVESIDRVDENQTPDDLWWNRQSINQQV